MLPTNLAEFQERDGVSFGEWLTAIMGLTLMTLASLAAACDVQPSTVSRWRSGAMPRSDKVALLARAFGVSEREVVMAVQGKATIPSAWHEHLSFTQQADTWKETWRSEKPLTFAERLFDIVEHVWDQEVNLKELELSKIKEPAVSDILDAVLASAAKRLDPGMLKELSAYLDSLAERGPVTENQRLVRNRKALTLARLLEVGLPPGLQEA